MRRITTVDYGSTEKALAFLKSHQPLPDDSIIDEKVIEEYDEVRKYFLANPDSECIQLFLNSFGNGNGLGVYQLIETVIAQFDAAEVIPHLKTALSSQSSPIRFWNALISTRFPSSDLIKPLSALLKDQSFDIRCAAITSLEEIGGDEVRQVLTDALRSEDDDEIIELINDVLDGL